ncbi:hypothetical protein [Rhizomonospora bruguierae]|uniref:hypothetical protein n=1 Tax=Rhizomonospora bruguierae TaxID=1581705 RepID=UPI001BD181CB|nr:hypothetical protein [Micromonospora sp. NBRC 107566]
MNPISLVNSNGRCTKRRKDGEPCRAMAIAGMDACRRHVGMAPAAARAKGAVVVEIHRWGLGDTTVDPGEVLLRLVTQSAARVELYSRLLGEAFDAAERLREAHAAQVLLASERPTDAAEEHPAMQAAHADLERVFATGGVGALIGHRYDADRDGRVYPVDEGIRGLAKLEAEERDRCANFATKAVAAGLAERQVRLAERQGALLAAVIQGVLRDLGVLDDPRVPALVAQHVQALTSSGRVIEGRAS